MSFLSKLTIDGNEYKVLESSYSLHQPTDHTGKPEGRPVGGQIMIVVESEGKTDLFQWMKGTSLTKSGSLTFYKRDALSKLFELKFINGFCIDYREHFLASTTRPMTISITISAQAIEVNGIEFTNLWGL